MKDQKEKNSISTTPPYTYLFPTPRAAIVVSP